MAKQSSGCTKQNMKETENTDDDDGCNAKEQEEEDVDGNERKQHAVNGEEEELHESLFNEDNDTVDDENDVGATTSTSHGR